MPEGRVWIYGSDINVGFRGTSIVKPHVSTKNNIILVLYLFGGIGCVVAKSSTILSQGDDGGRNATSCGENIPRFPNRKTRDSENYMESVTRVLWRIFGVA